MQCKGCGAEIAYGGRGRPRKWCDDCASKPLIGAAKRRRHYQRHRRAVRAAQQAYIEANRARLAAAAREWRQRHRAELEQGRGGIYVPSRERRRRVIAKKRAALDEIKREIGCMDCGTTEGRLDFDHRAGEVKLFNVADGVLRRWEVLLAEVEKCDVRCVRCHAQRHRRKTGQFGLGGG